MRGIDRASGSRALAAGSAVAILFVFLGTSCASTRLSDAGFRHREHGYRVPHPPAGDGVSWRIVPVDDAHVAYRSVAGAYMALDSRCDVDPVAEDPAVLGRQLLVGIANRERIESEDFAFLGGRAYSQLVEADADDDSDMRIRTRTVTLVREGCVIDWVLVVGEGHPEIEASFDAWWRGFEPTTRATADVSESHSEATP